MNRLNPNTAQQPALNWSARLGKLAAELPAPPATTALPLGAPPIPPRLSAILSHFGRRAHVRSEMNRSLRANELMLAP